MPFKPPERAFCPKCNQAVYAAEERIGAGKKWHKQCFKCGECSQGWIWGFLDRDRPQTIKMQKENAIHRDHYFTVCKSPMIYWPVSSYGDVTLIYR